MTQKFHSSVYIQKTSVYQRKNNLKTLIQKDRWTPSVYSNIIYNRQDKEATCLPTGIENNEDVVYTYRGILLSHKE